MKKFMSLALLALLGFTASTNAFLFWGRGGGSGCCGRYRGYCGWGYSRACCGNDSCCGGYNGFGGGYGYGGYYGGIGAGVWGW